MNVPRVVSQTALYLTSFSPRRLIGERRTDGEILIHNSAIFPEAAAQCHSSRSCCVLTYGQQNFKACLVQFHYSLLPSFVRLRRTHSNLPHVCLALLLLPHPAFPLPWLPTGHALPRQPLAYPHVAHANPIRSMQSPGPDVPRLPTLKTAKSSQLNSVPRLRALSDSQLRFLVLLHFALLRFAAFMSVLFSCVVTLHFLVAALLCFALLEMAYL